MLVLFCHDFILVSYTECISNNLFGISHYSNKEKTNKPKYPSPGTLRRKWKILHIVRLKEDIKGNKIPIVGWIDNVKENKLKDQGLSTVST